MNYVLRLLTNRLRDEENSLKEFEYNLNSENEFTVRQAKGSIPSCTHRINELKEGIEHIKNYKKPLCADVGIAQAS